MQKVIKELKEINKNIQFNILNRAVEDLKKEDFEEIYKKYEEKKYDR